MSEGDCYALTNLASLQSNDKDEIDTAVAQNREVTVGYNNGVINIVW